MQDLNVQLHAYNIGISLQFSIIQYCSIFGHVYVNRYLLALTSFIIADNWSVDVFEIQQLVL